MGTQNGKPVPGDPETEAKTMMNHMVVFDLDDTLHMRAAPFAEAVRERFPEFGEDPAGRLFTDFRAIGVDYFHQWDAGTITEEEMYIRRTIDTFALYGRQLSRAEAARFHDTYGKYLQTIRPAEGIEAALQTASALGFSLGILTNGSPVRQREKIRALGLTRLIPEAHIVVSLELGVHKPDPEVFRRYRQYILAENEGCTAADSRGTMENEAVCRQGKDPAAPTEWWYVGDLYEHDIEPAARDGWKTIWMVHEDEDQTVKRVSEPNYIVKNAEELARVFRKIAGWSDGT